MTDLEEAFHVSRRMFVLQGKVLLLAEVGDPRSHEEWFKAAFKTYDWSWMGRYVRGFVDSRGLFMYIRSFGSDWDVTPKVLEKAPQIVYGFHVLESLGGPKIPHGLPVYAGMVPGALGTLWEPKCRLDMVTGSITSPPAPGKQGSDIQDNGE